MRRLVLSAATVLAVVLAADSTVAYAQMTVKIPFKFDAGGKPFPAGSYWIGQDAGGSITLRQEPDGAQVSVPCLKKLTQPTPVLEQPQLVFDMVGNFEPSYTEYVTDYLLSEVWLEGTDGFLVLATQGPHQHQIVKGQKVKK
jgi:hypothetical protein